MAFIVSVKSQNCFVAKLMMPELMPPLLLLHDVTISQNDNRAEQRRGYKSGNNLFPISLIIFSIFSPNKINSLLSTSVVCAKTSREIKKIQHAKELELVEADNFLIKSLLFVEISAGSSDRELIRDIVVKKGFRRVCSTVIGFALTFFHCADFLFTFATENQNTIVQWKMKLMTHRCTS